MKSVEVTQLLTELWELMAQNRKLKNFSLSVLSCHSKQLYLKESLSLIKVICPNRTSSKSAKKWNVRKPKMKRIRKR